MNPIFRPRPVARVSAGAMALALASVWTPPPTFAASPSDPTLVIKDHTFEPPELAVPAGKAFKLVIDNQDATAEEFESHDLRIEKIIPGNSKAIIRFGPLKPGVYPFVGEFHEKTAKGRLIAK